MIAVSQVPQFATLFLTDELKLPRASSRYSTIAFMPTPPHTRCDLFYLGTWVWDIQTAAAISPVRHPITVTILVTTKRYSESQELGTNFEQVGWATHHFSKM